MGVAITASLWRNRSRPCENFLFSLVCPELKRYLDVVFKIIRENDTLVFRLLEGVKRSLICKDICGDFVKKINIFTNKNIISQNTSTYEDNPLIKTLKINIFIYENIFLKYGFPFVSKFFSLHNRMDWLREWYNLNHNLGNHVDWSILAVLKPES